MIESATLGLITSRATLCAAGLRNEHSLVVTAASLLESNQLADRRWPGEDGPSQDVHATLEVLWAVWFPGRTGE
jgi:hypothetical protein